MTRGIVLVIDDEEDLIEPVRYNLNKEGFDVIVLDRTIDVHIMS